MSVATVAPDVAAPALPEIDLVRAAALAPSPDNNQPWRFRFDDGRLLVYEDATRRLPSDVCSMFSMLAIGAAVENIVVEATRHGLSTQVNFVGTGGERGDSPVAEMTFSPGIRRDGLVAALENRCTNRLAFSRQPVADAALERMQAAAAQFDGCRVTWLTERAAIRRMSKLVAVADRLRFERAEFHAELYRQLRLTAEEAERTRDGLDLRTLGLPPGGSVMLRVLKSWPLVRALNRLGLSRVLTAPSAALVRNSGALGVIAVETSTADSFFAAGRALERLWLAATTLGLSVHPLGSLPIFVGQHELLDGRALDPHQPEAQARKSDAPREANAQPLASGGPASLTLRVGAGAARPPIHGSVNNPGDRHARLAQRLSRSLRNLLPAMDGQTLVMVFRLGVSKPAPHRSLRRPVHDVLAQDSEPKHPAGT